MSTRIDLPELARLVPAGARLGLPADYAGVAMAAVVEVLRQRPARLRLVCVPTGGLQVDLLIGAGLVESLETSAVSLGEAGAAPCFGRAVRDGAVRVIDATCPAVHAGLMAAQKGIPFMPIRGLVGSDVLVHRPDWRLIDNPFAPDDPIVVVPPIHLDVALFHAPEADREGNVWIGRRRELAAMAYAAQTTLVTVERIVEGSLLGDEKTAAGVLPSLYVSAVAHVPRGADPCGLWGEYAPQPEAVAAYARAAASAEGFGRHLASLVAADRVTA